MFNKADIDAAELDWKDADEFNESLSKLKKGQVKFIKVEGDLARSKLAWKIATYSEAIRYRLIEVTEACIDEWQKERFVACFIMARVIIETVAALYELEHQLQKLLANKDLDAIDAMIMKRTFGTRLADLFGGKKAYEAVSVLTTIDKLDKFLKGHVREAYDRLSEYTHTNYMGVCSSYEKIDYKYGDVTYGNQNTKHNVFMRLQGEFGLLELANITFEKIKSHVKATADLQHELD
ncbi:MAG: hypothetical protein WBK55_07680 [Alphaproteobacteria bacterium]